MPEMLSKSKTYLRLLKIFKISLVIWLFCLLISSVIFGYVIGVRKEMFDKTPDILAYSFFGFFIIGSLAFLIAIIVLTSFILLKKYKRRPNIFLFLIKLFAVLAILPLYLTFYIINPFGVLKKIKELIIKKVLKPLSFKSFLLKLFYLFLTIIILYPIWAGSYLLIGLIIKDRLGYVAEPISISGTGSMFPTFPKGEGKDPKKLGQQIVDHPGMIRYPNGLVIAGKRFLNYEIGRGDIVVVENKKIREMTKKMYGYSSGWVKRVIAVGGDTVELRGGIVYLNGEPLKEPYIAKPRSTFGQSFLKECKKVVVPKDHIFVMGDNRKGSGDSREIGFIELRAVDHVLPLKDQKDGLVKHWRNTNKDFDDDSKIKLDKQQYLQLLNQKRREFGARELKYQPKLELSAQKRGKITLKFNDLSFEATKSGYTMEKSMADANYSNIVYGEAPVEGYYEAEELIENQFQFPETKDFLTDKRYQEVGIAEVEGEINGCPTQVIVQHFAGYVPPNYPKEVIESWRQGLLRLKEILPGWQKLKEYKEFYEKNKQDIDRINEIINLRIANISAIVNRMEANQWLNDQEKRIVDQDEVLAGEQEEIAKRLNSQE